MVSNIFNCISLVLFEFSKWNKYFFSNTKCSRSGSRIADRTRPQGLELSIMAGLLLRRFPHLEPSRGSTGAQWSYQLQAVARHECQHQIKKFLHHRICLSCHSLCKVSTNKGPTGALRHRRGGAEPPSISIANPPSRAFSSRAASRVAWHKSAGDKSTTLQLPLTSWVFFSTHESLLQIKMVVTDRQQIEIL